MFKTLIEKFSTDSQWINFILVFLGLVLLVLLFKYRRQVRTCISLLFFLVFLGVFTGVINYKAITYQAEMKVAEKAIESKTGGNVEYRNGKLYAKIDDKWVNISDKIDTVNDTVNTVVAGNKVAVETITDLVNDNKDLVKIDDDGIKVKQKSGGYIKLDQAAINAFNSEVKISKGVIRIKCKNRKTNSNEWVDITQINSNYTVPKELEDFVKNSLKDTKKKVNKAKKEQ